MTRPVCVNVMLKLKVLSEEGLKAVRGDNLSTRRRGKAVECPPPLQPWFYGREDTYYGARNSYMLKVEFFYFNVLPHSKSVTACGVPDLKAASVAIKASSSSGGTTKIARGGAGGGTAARAEAARAALSSATAVDQGAHCYLRHWIVSTGR